MNAATSTTISALRRLVVSRLVILVPLLLTVLAACGNGTGGGPGY